MSRFSLLSLVLVLGLGACASETADPEITKDEARARNGSADDGKDYCEINGWYDDAVCDDFCPLIDPDCGLASVDGDGPTLCVGVRGNGTHIQGHFASLARITETWGLVDGISGGSSGSISSFLLESIQMNPAVQCDDCSPIEQGQRASLLLKSITGYAQVIASGDEGSAFAVVQEVVQQVQEQNLEALASSDPQGAVEALNTILSSERLASLINPELIFLLDTSPNVAFHIQDIISGLQGAASFTADNPHILLRPGVVNFDAVANEVGAMGTFYAGYQPADPSAMEAFLDACAPGAVGQNWLAIASASAGDATCGELFAGMVASFSENLASGSYRLRTEDQVGANLPALISTSVLRGSAVESWNAARSSYLSGVAVEDLDMNFDDVRFGYFGQQSELDALEANTYSFSDEKTRRRHAIGQATWRQALNLSPAEPGLARALEIEGTDLVSAGGWSDLSPVQALRSLGCEQVMYVTRRGPESGFAQGVARLLGMSDADAEALFDLGNAQSGYAAAVAEADAVWCTDWNSLEAAQQTEIWLDAYSAPMESDDAYFVDAGYASTSDNLGFAGCTAGVTP